MIHEDSIQEVRDAADLVKLARPEVKGYKKRGANYIGCCPFHEENTASFSVSPTKGIYKCFGCGKSGDAIKFIQEIKRLDFIQAIRYLAAEYNITLKESRQLSEEETQEAKAKKADYLEINKWAAKKYQDILLEILKADDAPVGPLQHPSANELLRLRSLTVDTIVTFQLGYAPADGRVLSPHLKERGRMVPAEELGLVNQGQNGAYDCFRDRIIFPIHNERGDIVGFGARTMKEVTDSNPKYLNSRDSAIFNKSKLLYGLYFADKSIRNGLDPKAADIRKEKLAMLVEGYYDVLSFHQALFTNTIAGCGTAFTEGHAKLLRRYTNRILQIGDGDAAGRRANIKNVDLLLTFGFKIEICALPEKEDPDSFARANRPEEEPAPAEVEEMEDAA